MPIVTYFISYVWRTVRTILRSVEHCKYTHFSMYSCIEGHHKDEEEKNLQTLAFVWHLLYSLWVLNEAR